MAAADGQHAGQSRAMEQDQKTLKTEDVEVKTSTNNSEEDSSTKQHEEPFPWHIGVYDAHCHPTDSMHAIPDLPNMKAQVLTIMATRFQDQDLVAKVASQYPHKLLEKIEDDQQKQSTTVIPSFGYHPWFSHLIYDDLNDATNNKPDKAAHYTSVLTSAPPDKDLVASLPDPTPLSSILAQTRSNLEAHPNAILGEVGLDRTFRISHGAPWRSEDPDSELRTIERAAGLTPGTHHSHPLTKHRVKPAHQVRLLQAQLRLAGELDRAASVHVVGGQGAAFDAMRELWRGFEIEVRSARERKMLWRKKGDAAVVEEEEEEQDDNTAKNKPFPPRICLHSFSGPSETVGQYLHPTIPVKFYFSFSEVINFSLAPHQRSAAGDDDMEPSMLKALAAIKAVPDDRLLVESDLHICGERMDGLLEDIVRRVCKAKDWDLETGTRRLKKNWSDFVFGVQQGLSEASLAA